MRARVPVWILAMASLVTAVPALAGNYNYTCAANRYKSVPLGTESVEFRAPISAVAPGNDSVDVIFEPHFPGGWFAQWCQASTGICYFESQRIRLVVGVPDTLRIDFFPDPTNAGFAYVNLKIRSAADPLEFTKCTYTLYSGMPVPTGVNYRVDCSDNTRFVTHGESVVFNSPMRNLGTLADSVHVRMTPAVPGDWFAQFCQKSTGICYFETATLPLRAGATDTLQVDVYMFDVPGQGSVEVDLQSAALPSYAQYCYYRVFLGSYPGDAPEVRPALAGRPAWAEPNPFDGSTTLRLRLSHPAAGSLTLFGADGRLVRAFTDQRWPAGLAAVRWDGRDTHGAPVPAGVYFYRFRSDSGDARGMVIRTR